MRSEELADALELLADGPPWDTAWLRSLLPELAVRGRLVAQEEGDEGGARELIESSMNARLEAAGGKFTRASAHLPEEEISDAERRLVPDSWGVVPLGNIVAVDRGITFPGSAKSSEPAPGRVACLRTTNVQQTVEWDDLLYVPDDYIKSARNWVRPGDLLMSTANSRDLVGKVALVGEPPVDAAYGGFLTALRPLLMLPGFLVAVLRTDHARNLLIGSATQTTNIANISMGRLRPFPLPVPPLAEQHRIVAQVDELMEHAAVVEERHLAATSARVRLRDAALHALAEAEDHEAVETAWSRIEEHFDDLFTEPEDIQPLRQTILQLAVRGRLVAQEAGDEDARATVGEVCSLLNGYAFKSSWYVKSSEGVRVVRNANVSHGFLEWSEERRVSLEKATEFKRFDLVEGDVLLSLDRPVISSGLKLARVTASDLPCLLLQRVLAIRPSSNWIARDYLYCWLQSPEFRNRLDPGRSNGVPHVSSKEVSEMSLRIPPLAEQHRIVAKVDELMALCDTLETSLTRAKATREQFAGSISHALAESH